MKKWYINYKMAIFNSQVKLLEGNLYMYAYNMIYFVSYCLQ